MGLFSGIKSRYKKSEAAVVVQKLLEHQANVGMCDLDPRKTANKLVELHGVQSRMFLMGNLVNILTKLRLRPLH